MSSRDAVVSEGLVDLDPTHIALDVFHHLELLAGAPRIRAVSSGLSIAYEIDQDNGAAKTEKTWLPASPAWHTQWHAFTHS